jgi:hypothetical protein
MTVPLTVPVAQIFASVVMNKESLAEWQSIDTELPEHELMLDQALFLYGLEFLRTKLKDMLRSLVRCGWILSV